MPVLAIGGDHSFGPTMAHVMRFAADNVQQAVIQHSGHWLMEEQPVATIAAIRAFLAKGGAEGAANLAPVALSAAQVDAIARSGAGSGTSGVGGIETTILSGDPAAAGPYAIEIRVPPNTRIGAHIHRDDRYAMVVSGAWYFGYGDQANDSRSTALASGAFYTEPAGVAHYAFTREAPAVVYITGLGPTDTHYVSAQRASNRQPNAPQAPH
jgi:uncharacterized RmlC-like cupin family protein